MPTRNIYEEERWNVVARHTLGILDKKDVTLTFRKVKADGTETVVETVKKKIEKNQGEVRHEIQMPLVPDDEPSYRMVVDAEYARYIGKDKAKRLPNDCMVWPRNFEVLAKDEKDGKEFQGFEYTAKQGTHTLRPPKTKADGKSSFGLKMDPSEVALQPITPHEIVETKRDPKKLRSVELKVKRNFTPEVVRPKARADGKPHRQYVNLDTAKDGQDQLGHAVTVVVGVQADPAGKKGKKGDTIWIQVEFGRESKRNDPKPALLAPVQEIAESAAGKRFKGKVVLAADDGTCDVKLEVGVAGGDTAKLYLSSVKDGFADKPDLEFVNWRKIWYEVMAPDCITLEDNVLEDGTTKVKAFVAAGAANLKTQGDSAFVNFEPYKSHAFTEAEANTAGAVGTYLPREFFELAAGPAKRYLLTDYTFTKYPKAFDKGKGKRGALIKACNFNLFNDGPGSDADKTLDRTVESVADAFFDVWTSHTCYWSPKSAYASGAAAASIRKLTWEAVVSAAAVRRRPTVETAPYVPTASDGNANLQVVTVRETHQRVSHQVKFVGAGTALSAPEQTALDTWIRSLCTVAKLRPSGNELRFELSGAADGVKDRVRLAELGTALSARVAAVAPELAVHPGLDDAGTPRKGDLGAAGVDMTKSTWKKVVVKLPAAGPTDPGSFIGVAGTEGKCPVKLHLEYEPQHGGLGLAGQGAQKGELLFVYDADNPVCSTDTMLHELGHQFAMTPYNAAANSFAPGMRKPKSTAQDEDVEAYKGAEEKGQYYDGHDHSGNHCAFGLTDAQKALASYGGQSGKCTLFGEAPSIDARRVLLGFCPQCIDYIRARDLSELK